MPRKNNRPRPPEQRTHQFDSFTMWAEKILQRNKKCEGKGESLAQT